MSDYTVVYLLTWLSVVLGLTSFAATLIVLDSNWWRSRRVRREMSSEYSTSCSTDVSVRVVMLELQDDDRTH